MIRILGEKLLCIEKFRVVVLGCSVVFYEEMFIVTDRLRNNILENRFAENFRLRAVARKFGYKCCFGRENRDFYIKVKIKKTLE
jgi:hypothetical protein